MGDFSLIRLLFSVKAGDKVVTAIKLMIKIGFTLGIILVVLSAIVKNKSSNFFTIFFMAGLLFLGMGLLGVALIFILSILGFIYNKVRNVSEDTKSLFRK